MSRLLQRYPLIGMIVLILGATRCDADEPRTSPWGIGVDLKVDAARGRDAGAWTGSSLLGYGLVHADWQPAPGTEGTATWRGYASVLGLAGRGPTEKFLFDFMTADNIEGFESLRLYSWWLERNQGAWSIRAGALLADEEFTGTDSGGHFLNSSFGWPAFISADTVNTGPAFFVAAPGARLRWSPSERASWQIGVYDGDTFDSPTGDPTVNRHGWHYGLGGSQGWFVITEVEWQAAVETGLRGKVGSWLHTADFADVYHDATGKPLALTGAPARQHSGNYGAYAVLERTLRGKSGEAGCVDSHVRIGFAPSDRNALHWAVDTGLSWRGLLPGRAQDSFSAGYSYAGFSSDYAANAKLVSPGDAPPDFEHVLELSYEWHCGEHLILQPDFQWIGHTGGTSAQSQSILCTLRISSSY